MELFECIPNISAGVEPKVVDSIVANLSASGASLLHVDRGPGVNRTVLTIAGTYQQVLTAALALYEAALSHIDMRHHRGAHPRLGAVDVCPIVPLFGSSMDRAIELAREIGFKLWERHKLPVFFYEEAAYSPAHRQLPRVRRGEFEGLAQRADLPDLWGGEYHPSAGATIIGARKILIAYNISVHSAQEIDQSLPLLNKAHALSITKQIAAQLRSQVTRCPETGKPLGGLRPHLRAIGWQLADTNELQISCNLTDYTVTSVPNVFRLAESLIQRQGWEITSSEVIGLCPAKALLENAYITPPLEKLAKDQVLAEELLHQINVAATQLKLKEFDAKSKVLEFACMQQGLY